MKKLIVLFILPTFLFGCVQRLVTTSPEDIMLEQAQSEKTENEYNLPPQGIVNDYPLNADELNTLLSNSTLGSLGWKTAQDPQGDDANGKIRPPRTRPSASIFFMENDKQQTCILSLRDMSTAEEQLSLDKNVGRDLNLSFWHRNPNTPKAQLELFSQMEEPLFWELAGEIINDKENVQKLEEKYRQMLEAAKGNLTEDFLWSDRVQDVFCKAQLLWDDNQKLHLLTELQFMHSRQYFDSQIEFKQYLYSSKHWPQSISEASQLKKLAETTEQVNFKVKGVLKHIKTFDNDNFFYSTTLKTKIYGKMRVGVLEDENGSVEVLINPTTKTDKELSTELFHLISYQKTDSGMQLVVQLSSD